MQKYTGGDCSWEVRAFADDVGSATWPPRSYACTFCKREFRSAQALGGHMNVHRRDRARLRQSVHVDDVDEPSPAGARTVILPSQGFVDGRVFYSISNPAGTVFVPATSDSPHRPTAVGFPMGLPASSLLDKVGMCGDYYGRDADNSSDGSADVIMVEEIDLELRLGW